MKEKPGWQEQLSEDLPDGLLRGEEILSVASRVLSEGSVASGTKILRRKFLKQRNDWRGQRLFEKVVLGGSNGARTKLFLKYARPAPGEEILPQALEREAEAYRDYLQPMRFGTPKFYTLYPTHRGKETVLFLEFVQGRRLRTCHEHETWLATARWLGRLHQSLSERAPDQSHPGKLLRHDHEFYWTWARRASEAMPEVSADAQHAMDRILSHYDRVALPLSQVPSTLIHGEFYCTNVLVERDENGLRICPFDWETAAVGCGALDLTYLLRQRCGLKPAVMASAYLEGWREKAAPPFTHAELMGHVRRCRIHELVYLAWNGAQNGRSTGSILAYLQRVEKSINTV